MSARGISPTMKPLLEVAVEAGTFRGRSLRGPSFCVSGPIPAQELVRHGVADVRQFLSNHAGIRFRRISDGAKTRVAPREAGATARIDNPGRSLRRHRIDADASFGSIRPWLATG